MKYLVISDIHGIKEYASFIPTIVGRENPDHIIFLGDLLFHGFGYESDNFIVSETLNLYANKCTAIRGNNDSSYDEVQLDFKLESFFKMVINNKLFFFTHGHLYNEANIPTGVDVLVQGHTHKYEIRKEKDLIIANPGSISLPRGETLHSYMIIDDKITIKDIDGNIIMEDTYGET